MRDKSDPWKGTSDPWKPEWTEALREFRREGLSNAGIAKALKQRFPETAFSRNAVIGKARRIGLKLPHGGKADARRGDGAHHMRTASPRSAPAPKLLPAYSGAMNARDPKRSSIERPLPRPRKRTGPIIPPNAAPVTIDQLASHHCRWPIDPDPAAETPEWLYCGAPRNPRHKSYCPFHAERSSHRGRAA